MIRNLFVLSPSGEVLIEKHWCGQVRRNVTELFWEHVTAAADRREVLPVIATPRFYFVSVYRCGMFFLSTVQNELPPLLVLEAQHRIVDVFQMYFKKVTPSVMRAQFATIYQLLDELVDGGFPFTTEPNQLKDMILPPSLGQKLLENLTNKFSVRDRIHDGSARIPWRTSNARYISNGIFFDQIEYIDAIVAANQSLVCADVYGDIRTECKLTGMPDVTLIFNRGSMIDDVSLHRCVRINKWRTNQVVSFVPPDGKFKLLSYRVRNITQLPVSVSSQINIGRGNGNVNITVNGRFTREKPIEGVHITIPFPQELVSSSLTANVGSLNNDVNKKITVWNIGRIPRDTIPRLTGTLTFPQDFKCDERPTLKVAFSIKSFCASGLSIDTISVRNVKYKPTQGKRVVTRSGNIDVRT